MLRLPLFLVFQLAFCFGHAQQLSFYRESLNFELDSTRFYVSGMYFLRNESTQDISTNIYYPYVYETDQIDSIAIYNCNTMEYITPFAGKKGHWFKLSIPASDSVIVNIKYHHKHNGSEASYILTTTQFWKHPFQMADYTLRVSNTMEVNTLFMNPDTTWQSSGYTYFYWKRYHYMPEADFITKFKAKD